MAQPMVAIIVAITDVALLAAMSLHANGRFKSERRLPMQWWLDGSVTWTAPRPVALAFTPVLAAACLTLLPIVGWRVDQDDPTIAEIVLAALAFLAVHAFHLWLIHRTVQRR